MMADNYDRDGNINVYTTFDIPFAAGAEYSLLPEVRIKYTW